MVKIKDAIQFFCIFQNIPYLHVSKVNRKRNRKIVCMENGIVFNVCLDDVLNLKKSDVLSLAHLFKRGSQVFEFPNSKKVFILRLEKMVLSVT